jgi:hypothetical protein
VGLLTSDTPCRERREAPSYGRVRAKETFNWPLRGCGNAKPRFAEGRYFPNRRFEKARFAELAEYWWENRGKQEVFHSAERIAEMARKRWEPCVVEGTARRAKICKAETRHAGYVPWLL